MKTYTTSEISKILDIDPTRVLYEIKMKRLKGYQAGRWWIVNENDLMDYIKEMNYESKLHG